MQISFSLQMLFEKDGWPFIIVYLLQRFSFFIYLPTCLYLHFFLLYAARVHVCLEKNFMCALYWEMFLLPEYDQKKLYQKRTKRLNVLKSFCISPYQSITFFFAIWHFILRIFSIYFFGNNMSLSGKDIDVEFKLFERFCVQKTYLSMIECDKM